ncbi:MAG: glutamate 5-kinase [Rhodospirillales bacterium]|jgi:glutamate 5-kinase|nr:glutamate 5-kinase [Rhodospirillales bacterium]MBT5112389.1 glutamate 5-kinase [Rhodospirillales bacterium]MBT5673177.1 glutamate 5-kinase [Rhodospirillales bacterium]MBT6186917.1 glutamate 5-kinase [Rhodospirillales bacterium]MBT6742277.1 glutamate 5-kinase [Rhodospirillales bacterium]
MSQKLIGAKRMVVKVGSALLADEAKGAIRTQWLSALAKDIAEFRAAGTEVLLVSSGAVAVGCSQLGLDRPQLRLEEKQAAAATGQIRLAHAYQEALAHHKIDTAQILLTLDDTEERRRYLNARNTLDTLLRLGAVPVINENDTIATNEIRYGDNDRLAARVATMISADTLVLLSTIDGLYDSDPLNNKDAKLIPEVRELTPDICAMAGDAPPGYTSGGMVTKLEAARLAMGAGCRMVIADGSADHALGNIDSHDRHTWFIAKENPLGMRKHWIASSLKPAGSLTLDSGAVKALYDGKSLLPAGVSHVEGNFDRGDAVIVKTVDGTEIARGLVAYAADDARRIAGHKSREIEEILGYRGRSEMIHRDDLVVSGEDHDHNA